MFNWFKQVYLKKELMFFIARREIYARYKQTAFGMVWAILHPMILMIIFTIIGGILNIDSGGIPRPIFYYSAVLPWTFFSTSMNQASNSLIANANLVRQVYFPREILPWSSIMISAFDFFISLSIFGLMVIYYGIELTVNLLYFPIIFSLQIIFMIGLSLIFSGLNVAFRDIRIMIGLILQIWLYASPIIYPLSTIPEKYMKIYFLNPMAAIIDSYRRILVYGVDPNFAGLIIGFLISSLIFILSYTTFKKTEKLFADII